MKSFLLSLILCSATAVASIPLPTLFEYHYPEERIFGLYWISDGIEYKYLLEANTGGDWFPVAEWLEVPKGISMTGYTYYGFTQPMGIARVRVERVENPPPTPRGLAKWKVLTPVRF